MSYHAVLALVLVETVRVNELSFELLAVSWDFVGRLPCLSLEHAS